MNPFETSVCESQDAFLSIQDKPEPNDSPIQNFNFDAISQKFSNCNIFSTNEQKQKVQQMHKSFNQLTRYCQMVQKRHLQIVVELQKQKLKNQQLSSVFNFMKQEEEHNVQQLFEKNNNYKQNLEKISKLTVNLQRVEAQLSKFQSQNTYMKELIIKANENYQRLSIDYEEVCSKIVDMQMQKDNRQEETMKKMAQIKQIFTKIVSQQAQKTKIHQPLMNITNFHTANSSLQNTTKSGGKKQIDDVYRQFFFKTLKSKKQNKVL